MMKRLISIMLAVALLVSAPALAYYGEGGASMTINGVSGYATCYTGSGGNCLPQTLAWNKGTTNYTPYALYRLQSDNCGGGDNISIPGIQVACPVAGIGSITIYPSVSAPGCTGINRYYLITAYQGQTCAAVDAWQNPLVQVDLTLSPAP